MGNMLAVEHFSNPTGFDFTNSNPCAYGTCYHSPRVLYIDEIGYQTHPTPGNLGSWYRVTGYYNTTDYHDLSSTNPNATTKNYAVSFYFDQQLWQSDPSSALTAYQGIYIGGQVAYDDPKADQLSQDYGFRIYTLGMFNRPKDQLAFSFERQVASHYLTDPIDSSATCTVSRFVCLHKAIDAYTVTYTANLMPGVYATLGAQYVDNPSLLWSPAISGGPAVSAGTFSPLNINHAFNFLASLYVNF
jgi:hypothetical protein